jgi:hypothetical protein
MTTNWHWGLGRATYVSPDGKVLAVLTLSGVDTWRLEGTEDHWFSLDEAVEGVEKRFKQKAKEAGATT